MSAYFPRSPPVRNSDILLFSRSHQIFIQLPHQDLILAFVIQFIVFPTHVVLLNVSVDGVILIFSSLQGIHHLLLLFMANGQSSPLPSRGHAELLEGDSDFRIAFGFVAGAQQRRGGMKVGLRRCG